MKTIKGGFLGLLFGMLIFPILFMLMLAFSLTWRYPQLIPESFSLHTFLNIFSSGSNLLGGLINSLLIAIVVTLVAVPLAFYISKQVAANSKRKYLILCAYLPFTLSPVIYAACLNYYFVLAGLNGTIFGVILAQLIIVFPYNIILFITHWNTQINSYSDLTATLGGNRIQTYFKVLIPLSKTILLIAFFQSFLISWFEFGLTNFIGIGQVNTLTIRVYQYINEANVQLAALSSLILILPPLFMLWLNKRIMFHQI